MVPVTLVKGSNTFHVSPPSLDIAIYEPGIKLGGGGGAWKPKNVTANCFGFTGLIDKVSSPNRKNSAGNAIGIGAFAKPGCTISICGSKCLPFSSTLLKTVIAGCVVSNELSVVAVYI